MSSPSWTWLSSSAFAGAAAVTTSFWIAVCTAAPEIIWQGSRIALNHIDREDLQSALLIGVFLAFFVEPVMDRIRHVLAPERHEEAVDPKGRNPLLIAGLALAFALASVSLHDAMTAFVSPRGGVQHMDQNFGTAAGIRITIEWAMVPFFVTLAWLSAARRWLAIAMGILAALSPFAVGWLFNWAAKDVITTAVPCALILALGHNQVLKKPQQEAFARCIRLVAIVGLTWLALSLLADTILHFYDMDKLRLYSWSGFWVDARFYFGWALGLALVPFPYRSAPISA
jgi:hypothetical protein